MKRYKVEYGMLVDTKENEILEHPYHSEYVDADIAQEIYDALRNLEVSANTVKYCYDNRPENFHRALSTLEHDAQIAREVIEKSDKD